MKDSQICIAIAFINLCLNRVLIVYKQDYASAAASISLMESLNWKCHYIEVVEDSAMPIVAFFSLSFDVRNYKKIPEEIKKQYY